MSTGKNRRHLLRLALVGIGLFVAACGSAAQQNETPGVAAEPTSATAGGDTAGTAEAVAEFDQMFIDMMVPHHESAIAMGQIALERAEHPELKTMADEMIAKQQEEITQLQNWRSEWYGSPETPPMNAMPMLPGMAGTDQATGADERPIMDATQDVEALRSAPEPFDLAFIDTILAHHTMAIEAGQMALDQAERQEIRDLAQKMIDDQQKEIAQLQEWRQAWYGEATPASP